MDKATVFARLNEEERNLLVNLGMKACGFVPEQFDGLEKLVKIMPWTGERLEALSTSRERDKEFRIFSVILVAAGVIDSGDVLVPSSLPRATVVEKYSSFVEQSGSLTE